jgi:hypothetical protein
MRKKSSPPDPGIANLLEMDGYILDQGDGYWVKIDAKQIAETMNIPHGIRYSLTLHEPKGGRILGYDNAHSVKLPHKFKFAGQKFPYDHKHSSSTDNGVPYSFENAHQLMTDFFMDVDILLKKIKGD